MYARCLGYLVIEADNDARSHLSHEILGCAGDRDRINSLAEFYINHLFRLCESFLEFLVTASSFIFLLVRKTKGRTPKPSEHPSQPSFENDRDFFSLTVDPAPKDHTAAKLAVSSLYDVDQTCYLHL
jgi:hypothetical protein